MSAFLSAAGPVATAADLCGARVLRVTEERSELRLVTGHRVPILCHRPSGQLVWALIDRNIVRVRVWDTKKTRHCPSPTNNNRAEEIPLWPDQSMIESLKIRREEID